VNSGKFGSKRSGEFFGFDDGFFETNRRLFI